MGKLNFESELMKTLAEQLENNFPSIECDEFNSISFDSCKIIMPVRYNCQIEKNYNICDQIETLVMDESIKLQKVSSELYGSALRTFLNRYKKVNRQVYIDDLCAELNIQRTYLYKILKGERRPSRNLAIAFCFVLKLTVQECQELIIYLGEQLNKFVKKDFIILYGLNNKFSLDAINETLIHHQSQPLTDLD